MEIRYAEVGDMWTILKVSIIIELFFSKNPEKKTVQ